MGFLFVCFGGFGFGGFFAGLFVCFVSLGLFYNILEKKEKKSGASQKIDNLGRCSYLCFNNDFVFVSM